MIRSHGLKLKRLKDHRRYSYPRTFGAVAIDIPPEGLGIDPPWDEPDQNAEGYPNGCTGYAQAYEASIENGLRYDPAFIYRKSLEIDNVPDGSPVSFESSLKAGRVYGLLAEGEKTDSEALAHRRGQSFEPEMSFIGFQTAMTREFKKGKKQVISIGSKWYNEWNRTGKDGIAPMADFSQGWTGAGHNYVFSDWKMIYGRPYMIAHVWQGKNFGDNGKMYFSQEQVDMICKQRGTQANITSKANPADVQMIQLDIMSLILSKLFIILQKMFGG